jgi:hypothetical protein
VTENPENWPVAARPPGLASAFAKAQAEFEPIHREKLVTVTMKSGGKYTFAYAPLETILRATVPALSKYGLAITQSVIEDAVETRVLYGEESLSTRVKIINTEGGAQAYGSALTYARRYGITLLLCVCADDDDDANAAEGNVAAVHAPRPINPDIKGDLGKNIPLDVARAHALAMLAIIQTPAQDGDHDELQKALSVLDYHEKHLAGKADLMIAAAEQMDVSKRNVWKALVNKARAAQKEDRAVTAAGRKF